MGYYLAIASTRLSSRHAAIAIAVLALAAALVTALFADRAGGAPIKNVSISGFVLATPNESPRLEVLCPKKKKFRFPYGTYMWAMPGAYSMGGEGVYPHSFERLGAQHGYHITPVLFDPMGMSTARSVTLGAICGPDPGPAGAVHAFTTIPPNGAGTAIARCPGKRKLFAGGFNLFNFEGTKGTFPTQAEAIDKKTWVVSGASFGGKGGDIAAIAYCRKGPGSFSFVEAETTIAPGTSGYVTTPPCPGKKFLIAAGYETTPHGALMFGSGVINPDDTYSAEGYNRSGAPATFEAYGYCLNVEKISTASKF
jgi:hypothetical protein